jgi:hypothetical protein
MTEKRKYSPFPKALAQVVEPLTRPVFKAQGLAGSRLLTEWQEVVGPSLAKHTMPEKLSFPQGKTVGGTLTIAVENGFATEVQHMQPIILERLATYYGYKAVNRIVISHSWTPVPVEKPQAPPPASLPRESTKLAEEATDSELKDALTSLAKTWSGQST